MLLSCARCQCHSTINEIFVRLLYKDQSSVQTLEIQTENILPVSLTVSIIQLMTTFNPSSGIQSNLAVGVGGFISNFPPLLRSIAMIMSACEALPAQRRACSVLINQCISILSSCVLNQWRSISIDLTRTSPKWICFGYV